MAHESHATFTFKDLTDLFDAVGMRCFLDTDHNALLAGFGGSFGKVHLQARLVNDDEVLLLTFHLTFCVPEHRRLAMADAVARANLGLMFGAFKLDMDDGELVFHIGLPLADATLTREQLVHCLAGTSAACTIAVPKFERVVLHDESPEDVLSRDAIMASSREPRPSDVPSN